MRLFVQIYIILAKFSSTRNQTVIYYFKSVEAGLQCFEKDKIVTDLFKTIKGRFED